MCTYQWATHTIVSPITLCGRVAAIKSLSSLQIIRLGRALGRALSDCSRASSLVVVMISVVCELPMLMVVMTWWPHTVCVYLKKLLAFPLLHNLAYCTIPRLSTGWFAC